MRRRTLKKAIVVTVVGVAAVAIAAFAAAGAGGLETYPAPLRGDAAGTAGAPAWTAPCWRTKVRSTPARPQQCARLRARVLLVKREDGRGDGDAHLVTVADRRIVYAKISLADQDRLPVPGIADTVTIVGPIVPGAHVREQVWAQALRSGL